MVEDNALQPQAASATCSSTPATRWSRPRPARRGSPRPRTMPPDLVLMDLQLPGHRRHEALRRLRDGTVDPHVPVVAVTAFAMTEDHERARRRGLRRLHREADQRARPASTRSRVPRTERRRDRAPGDRESVTVLVVDDLPPNLRLLDAVLSPRGYRVLAASRRRGGAGRADSDRRRRPGAARHRDARHGRLRGVPADPGRPAHRVPAGRDDHRERRPAADPRPRGRRRRLRGQAVRPGRAAGPGGLAGPDQALPRHHRAAGRRAGGVERRARAAGRRAGRRAGADRPAAPVPVPAAGRRWSLRRRVAARQPPARDRRACSATCAGSPRSPSPASPRR